MTTVGVIGAGRVGASCARAIVRDGLVTRLTIYDRTESHAQGEALDLGHALPMLEPCEIRGVDLVINGHIHRRLEDVQKGCTTWLTPGNISRRSR